MTVCWKHGELWIHQGSGFDQCEDEDHIKPYGECENPCHYPTPEEAGRFIDSLLQKVSRGKVEGLEHHKYVKCAFCRPPRIWKPVAFDEVILHFKGHGFQVAEVAADNLVVQLANGKTVDVVASMNEGRAVYFKRKTGSMNAL